MARLIGIDIGGGGVRAAVVDSDVLRTPILSCSLSDLSLGTIVSAVCGLIDKLGGADVVGISVAGFVEEDTVEVSPNIPSLNGANLADLLANKSRAVVKIHNDASCAAWGAGLVYGAKDLVLFTLGTGVGGGVVSGGHLVSGSKGMAGELGHIFVGGSRTCGCGAVGCLETWCSTVGLILAADEWGVTVSGGVDVVTAADNGEPWAQDILRLAAVKLGQGISTAIHCFNPSAVFISGGLSLAERWLKEPVQNTVTAQTTSAILTGVQIHYVGRADELAIVGAANLALGAS